MKRIIGVVRFVALTSAGCSTSRFAPPATPHTVSPAATAAAPSVAVGQIEIFSERLPSGYRVVLARTPAVPGREPRVYIGSYVLHGSMQESRFGWAHLMEHIVANNRNIIAGPPRPEGVNPINSNALTRPYYTSFVTIAPPSLLPSILHSRMARAGRAENDSLVFTTQVGRVLAELERDMAGMYPAYKALVALALGASPRLADEIELVRRTDQRELAATIAPIYVPSNAVLVVAGDIDLADTRAVVHETESRLRLTALANPARISPPTHALLTNRSAVLDRENRSNHFVIGVAWPKPPLGHSDQLPLLIADQLLLGRGESVENPVRSDASPIGIRLARSLGGSSFWDGRAGQWGAPDLIDTGPAIESIVFNSDRSLTVDQARDGVLAALREIWRDAISDAEIERARESLASFYERWFFEDSYRILSDHLMAYSATGRDPEQVKEIPTQIRRVRPSDVRDAFDRYFLRVQPNVVVLRPPTQ